MLPSSQPSRPAWTKVAVVAGLDAGLEQPVAAGRRLAPVHARVGVVGIAVVARLDTRMDDEITAERQ
jgi:hypothetical protein